MKIGIDARFYGSVGKGLGRYTEKLIKELEIIDGENEYVIFLCPENFSEYVPQNPRFQKKLTRSRWYSFAEQLIFPFLLRRERLDVMHFPHFNVPLLYRKPFLFTLHDLILFHYPTQKSSTRGAFFYWFKFFVYRVVLASALRRAEAIIAVSEFTKSDIVENYPKIEKKIFITKEATEQWCFWAEESTKQELFSRLKLLSLNQEKGALRDIIKPYILYVGNAYPHKNLEVLLEAAKLLPEEYFVFVGKEDFFYQRLKEKTQALHLDNVIFTDYVTDAELGILYLASACYAFPSLYEGFGLPPLEALQYGTPVLAARTSSLPEVLGEAALYFDPKNPREIVALVQKLKKEEETRDVLRQKGYQQASLHTWRQMAVLTHDLYCKKTNRDTKASSWTPTLTNHPSQ